MIIKQCDHCGRDNRHEASIVREGEELPIRIDVTDFIIQINHGKEHNIQLCDYCVSELLMKINGFLHKDWVITR